MGRPKVALLNRDLVIKAALQIVDADGLDGLSVRRLADEFGVRVGSLYHHFPSKDDILRRVCELIVLEVDPPDPDMPDWADLVVGTAVSFRRVLLRHDNAIPLMLRFEPHALVPALFDPYSRLLQSRGVPEDMVLRIIEAFDVMVLGSAAVHHSQVSQGNRAALRSRTALKEAEDAFESQCRALAQGFRVEVESRRQVKVDNRTLSG